MDGNSLSKSSNEASVGEETRRTDLAEENVTANFWSPHGAERVVLRNVSF